MADAGNGGGDFMVTLGLWDDSTGTEFVQTSITLHEMAHLFGIRHGGAAPQPQSPQFPDGIPSLNCKPNYQSISNYLFQILGLPGPSGPVIDLSRQVLLPLNETSLAEAPLTDIGEPSRRHGVPHSVVRPDRPARRLRQPGGHGRNNSCDEDVYRCDCAARRTDDDSRVWHIGHRRNRLGPRRHRSAPFRRT